MIPSLYGERAASKGVFKQGESDLFKHQINATAEDSTLADRQGKVSKTHPTERCLIRNDPDMQDVKRPWMKGVAAVVAPWWSVSYPSDHCLGTQ